MLRAFSLATALFLLPGCGTGLCVLYEACRGGGLSQVDGDWHLTLRAVEIDDSEITVSWTPPSVSNPSEFSYAVYYSTSPNLETAAEMRANGTLAGSVTNESSFKISSIAVDKDYYFNVLATAPGVEAAYEMRAPFCGGTGVSGDAFQICDAGSLQFVELHLGSAFAVTEDIDLTDTRNWNASAGFRPIGTAARFTGSFDGQNHTLENLYIDRISGGLFQEVEGPGAISNLVLVGALFNPSKMFSGGCGLVTGFLDAGASLTRVVASGALHCSTGGGGLVGLAINGSQLIECGADVAVTGAQTIGGLVGSLTTGSQILKSFATGNVVSQAQFPLPSSQAGGLVGHMTITGTLIEDSYATGHVYGETQVGGAIGQVSIQDPVVRRVYATGNVAATSSAGGLAGSSAGVGGITDSFATGNVTAASFLGAIVGSPAPTITNAFWFPHPFTPTTCYSSGSVNCAARPNPTWFYDLANYGGAGLNWDFSPTGVWIMPATGRYPVLRWQAPNESIEFPMEFRDGRKIGLSDMAAFRVWGFCGTPGETISFSGPNAPASTSCNGGTFSSLWDFSGELDGDIEIAVRQGAETPVARQLEKDTAHCDGVNDETVGATIQARFNLSAGPHYLCNVQQLTQLQANTANWSKTFRLGNNIDLTTYAGNPIGTPATPFTGTLDGEFFVLSNLTINRAADQTGLFGRTGNGIAYVTLWNIGLENVNVRGRHYTGALVGEHGGVSSTLVTAGIRVTGFVGVNAVANGNGVGGIIGRNIGTGSIGGNLHVRGDIVGGVDGVGVGGVIGDSSTTVSSAFGGLSSQGSVRGDSRVGGLVGNFATASTYNSYSTSDVSGKFTSTGTGVGGLFGRSAFVSINPAAWQSYSSGKVYGREDVGGIVGQLSQGAGVLQGYSSGSILGDQNVGGIVGNFQDASPATGIELAFSAGAVSAITSNAGTIAGLTTAAMPSVENYWVENASMPLPCIGNDSGGAIACSGALPRSNFYGPQDTAPLSLYNTFIWSFLPNRLPALQ